MQTTTNPETSDKCREAEWNTTRVLWNGLPAFWLAVWRVVWFCQSPELSLLLFRRDHWISNYNFFFFDEGRVKKRKVLQKLWYYVLRWIIAEIMRILDNEWEDSKHTTQQVMKVTRPQSAYPCVYVLALWKLRLEARMPALRSCYEATAVSNGKILILYGERQVDLLSLLPDFKPKKTRYESVNYQISDYCST